MRNERNEDLLERDIEKEERKLSEKVEKIPDKEIISKAKEIIDKDKIESSQERCVLERAVKLEKEKIQDNRQEFSKVVERIENHKPQKGDVKKASKLEKEYRESRSLIENAKDKLNPERVEQRESFSKYERYGDLLKRVENTQVHISSNKINAKSTALDEARVDNRKAVQLALDISKYQALTGRDISNITKTQISQLGIKKMDEKKVPKFELEKIATSRNPDALRTFYEMGLRVGEEKLKPEQINNACKLLNTVETKEGRIEVVDRLLSGKIQNIRMENVNNLARVCDEKGKDKSERKNAIDEELKKDDRLSKYDELRKDLLKDPEKTNEKIVDLLMTSDKKLDIDMLKNISKDAKATHIEGTIDDIKNFALSKNAEYLPELKHFGVEFKGIEIDEKKYKSAINLIDDNREKNDIIKMAIISTSLKNEKNERVLLGTRDEQKIEKEILSKKFDGTDLKDAILQIREDLKSPEKNIQKVDISRMDSKEATKAISNYFGELCSRDDYSRDQALSSLSEFKSTIKECQIDIRSLDEKDKRLKDADLIKISTKDPQLLLDIQKIGINLTRNGEINTERLQNRIDIMDAIPKEDTVERMAVLSTCLTKVNGNNISIKNPINLQDAEKNKEVKSLAYAITAEEKGISINRDVPKSIKIVRKAKDDAKDMEREKQSAKTFREEISREYADGRHRDEKYHQEKLIKSFEGIRDADDRKEKFNQEIYNIMFTTHFDKDLNILSNEIKNGDLGKILNNDEKIIIEKLKDIPVKNNGKLENCINIRGYDSKQNPTNRFIVFSALSDEKTPYRLSERTKESIQKEVDDLNSYLKDNSLTIKTAPSQIIKDYFNGKPDSLIKNETLKEEAKFLKKVGYDNVHIIQDGEKFFARDMDDIRDKYNIINDRYKMPIEDIKKEITSLKNIHEIEKDIPKEYRKNIQGDIMDARYSTIRNLPEIDSKYIKLTLSNSTFEELLPYRDTFQSSGLNFAYSFPSDEKFGTIELTNINIYSISALPDDVYNKLEKVFNENNLTLLQENRCPESNSIPVLNDFIRQCSDLERTLDRVAEGRVRLEIYSNMKSNIETINEKLQASLNDDLQKNIISKDTYDVINRDYELYKEDMSSTYSGLERQYEDQQNRIIMFQEMQNSLNEELERNESSPEDYIVEDDYPIPDDYYDDEPDYRLEDTMDINSILHWTVDIMMNFHSNRIENNPELNEYYEKIYSVEKELNDSLHSIPDMELVQVQYDFKTNTVYARDIEYGDEKLYEYSPSIGPVTNYFLDKEITLSNTGYCEQLYDRVENIKREMLQNIDEKINDAKRDIVNSDIYSSNTDIIEHRLENYEKDDESMYLRETAEYILILQEVEREIQEGRINERLIPTPEAEFTISEENITELLKQYI